VTDRSGTEDRIAQKLFEPRDIALAIEDARATIAALGDVNKSGSEPLRGVRGIAATVRSRAVGERLESAVVAVSAQRHG